MADLTYVPPGELGAVSIGESVVVMDRNSDGIGIQRIVKVRKTYVQTDCGRQWTGANGEWIGDWRGNRPVSYPFPSIRKGYSP